MRATVEFLIGLLAGIPLAVALESLVRVVARETE